MADTSVYLCRPTQVCLPLDITYDGDFNVEVNRGSYENGVVCFVPYDSGSYEIIATITDDCGTTIVDTANVRMYYSDDSGATWAVGGSYVLPEDLDISAGNVTTHRMDGRAFLRSRSDTFDRIQLTGVDTKAVLAASSLSVMMVAGLLLTSTTS